MPAARCAGALQATSRRTSAVAAAPCPAWRLRVVAPAAFAVQGRGFAVWSGEARERLLSVASYASAPSLALPALAALQSLAAAEAERVELERHRGEEADGEMRALYDSELQGLRGRLVRQVEVLELELLQLRQQLRQGEGDVMAEPDLDDRDAILEMAPGVGGQEAALFAGELFEMYARFAESQGWRFEVQQLSEGLGGGLLSATAKVMGRGGGGAASGDGPFGWLRFESGVHRVQRIPETERKGRMQTSSATVVVLPIALETDVSLGKHDVRIDISKKSSGPGGQSVNAGNQAVQVTHLATGLSVRCTSSQSQNENRALAFELLRTRILDHRLSEQQKHQRSERKAQRGTGDRSEKIRTYNFQRDDLVDHRLGKGASAEAGGIGANDVLFGAGLEGLLRVHLAHDRDARLDEAVDAFCGLVRSAARDLAPASGAE